MKQSVKPGSKSKKPSGLRPSSKPEMPEDLATEGEGIDLLSMPAVPFSESLKRISVQAKDWEFSAKPMPGKIPSETAPVRVNTLRPAGINWSKWACLVGVAIFVFLILQTLWIHQTAGKSETAEIRNVTQELEKLNARVESLQKKSEGESADKVSEVWPK